MGTLMVGLFSATEYGYGDGLVMSKGLFYGGGFKLLGVEALGVITVIAWVAVTMTIVFQILKHTVGLRASREEEILGLDITEHGLTSSYADFMPAVEQLSADALGDTDSTARSGSRGGRRRDGRGGAGAASESAGQHGHLL